MLIYNRSNQIFDLNSLSPCVSAMDVGWWSGPLCPCGRKDEILDLSKRTSVVCRVESGGPLTWPGHSFGSGSIGNRRFGLLGVDLASGLSAGGICTQEWVEVA